MQVRMIMGPVFESYREQVGKVITDAKVKTAGGKARYVCLIPIVMEAGTNLWAGYYVRRNSSTRNSVLSMVLATSALTLLAW
jgi:hypothetical protein